MKATVSLGGTNYDLLSINGKNYKNLDETNQLDKKAAAQYVMNNYSSAEVLAGIKHLYEINADINDQQFVKCPTHLSHETNQYTHIITNPSFLTHLIKEYVDYYDGDTLFKAFGLVDFGAEGFHEQLKNFEFSSGSKELFTLLNNSEAEDSGLVTEVATNVWFPIILERIDASIRPDIYLSMNTSFNNPEVLEELFNNNVLTAAPTSNTNPITASMKKELAAIRTSNDETDPNNSPQRPN